jgi:hypothetical protein
VLGRIHQVVRISLSWRMLFMRVLPEETWSCGIEGYTDADRDGCSDGRAQDIYEMLCMYKVSTLW